jgi:hypothetical protein
MDWVNYAQDSDRHLIFLFDHQPRAKSRVYVRTLGGASACGSPRRRWPARRRKHRSSPGEIARAEALR